MGFPQGCDFRATVGYVTDVSPNDFFKHTTGFPHTTAQGNNAGWEVNANLDSRDRSTSNIVPLAGINFAGNGTANPIQTFRIDLPAAGDYIIRMAAGDASASQAQYIKIYDDTTVIATFAGISTSSNSFADANGTVHTAANWNSKNATRTLTFASTICRVKIADPSAGANSTTLAYFYIEQATAQRSLLSLGRGTYQPIIIGFAS